MACPYSYADAFSDMLIEHSQQTVEIFSTSRQSDKFLTEFRLWMQKNADLCLFYSIMNTNEERSQIIEIKISPMHIMKGTYF